MTVAAVAWLLVALLGCDAKVAATNPYDSDTSPDRQAPASLSGRIVLVDDSRTTRESLEAEIVLVRVGLLGADGQVVRNQDGSPLWARLEVVREEAGDGGDEAEATSVAAAFEFVSLKPGNYRMRVEGLGRRYAPPGMPEVYLRPGTRSHVGDLVFVSITIDGPGPGEIGGVVRLEGGVGPDRSVELYRMESGRPELYMQKKTQMDGGFDFGGLPIGAYAVAANLEGFTPDYRLDIMVGETGGAALTHTFAGEESMLLRPVTAVLEPDVQRTEGIFYTNEDELPLKVLAFGGVESMRLSTSPLFLDECEEQACEEEDLVIPFQEYGATMVVGLPSIEGPIEIFAQFETRSEGGFVFVSPTFSTTVVRDVTKPRILRVAPIGVAANEDGSYFVTPGVTLEVDATDDHSAVAGGTLVLAESMPDPNEVGITVEYFPPGMARFQRPAPLPDEDGTWRVFAFVRDRAGNISDGEEIVLRIDREAPELPLLVTNAVGGRLTTRKAELELDETGEEDLPVTMQVGLAPLRSSAPVVSYEQSQSFDVAGYGHGSVVAFEARLTDAAGNSALVRSENIVLSLTGTISGRVEVERVPSYRPDHGGVEVSLHAPGADPEDPAVAEGVTDGEGRFIFAGVPEAGAYLLRATLEGYTPVEQFVPGVQANESVQLSRVEMKLAKGELFGRFQRYDEREVSDAHAGIIVLLRLAGSSRTDAQQDFTGPDGRWRVEVPVTLEGEAWSVEGMTQGYANANAGLHTVRAGEVTVVSPEPDDETVPETLMLHPISGDFILCAPTGACETLSYSNLDELRVRLANTSVTEVRVRARDSFEPDAMEPPFEPFDPAEILTVDVSGPEGQVVVYVQTRVGTEDGPVLSSSFVRDTTPPVIEGLTIDPGPDSIDPTFTSLRRVRATLQADSGAGGGVAVAPLAQARLIFAEEEPAALPLVDFVSCGHGASCEVRLPDEGDYPAERRHDLYGWACDMAGNCSQAPALASVVYDRTPPSSVHGAWVGASEEGTVTRDGVTYTRSPSYYVDLSLGTAQTAGGDALVDLDGQDLPDVLAYRLGVMPGAPPPNRSVQALSGTALKVIEGELIPGETTVVAGPPLPPEDGVYTVYAQLVDAAGNRSPLEASPFLFEITLDRTPPSVSFILNGGETVTNDPAVSLTVGYAPNDEPVRVELATDGGLFETVDEREIPLGGNDTLTLPAGPEGVYTVHARFYDAAGNMTERQASIRLDTTPPLVRQVRCVGCKEVDGDLFTNVSNRQVFLDVIAEDSGGSVVSLEVDVNGVLQVPAFQYGASVIVNLPDQDGAHEIIVTAIDEAGNRSILPDPIPETEAARIFVFLDRVAPHDPADPLQESVTVLIAHGATYTTSADVQVRVVAEDPAPSSGIDGIRLSSTPDFTGPVLPLTQSLSFTLDSPQVDESKTVHVELRDNAGNISTGSSTIILDTTPPSGSLAFAGLDNHPGYTPTRSVKLALSYGPDTAEYAYAEGSLNCETASYTDAVETEVSFQLSEGNGTKTVYLCLRDEAGNTFQTSASVVLDETAPTVTLILAEGRDYTATETVRLDISASPDAVGMSVHGTGVEPSCDAVSYDPIQPSNNVTLPTGDGVKTVYVCVRDRAWNVTMASASIILDQMDPDFTLALNGGKTHTNDPKVTASLTVSPDVGWMAFSLSESINCDTATYVAFAPTHDIDLPEVDGLYSVRACVKDHAGNNAAHSAQITLDRVPPSGSLTIGGPNVQNGYARARDLTLTIEHSSDAIGYSTAEGALECRHASYTATSDPSPTVTPFTIQSDGDGHKAVVACLKDRAGNTFSTTASVILDTVPPLAGLLGGFVIVEGDWVNDRNITLELGASGATRVRYGEDDDCSSPPESYTSLKSLFIASAGDGFKIVSVQYLDEAGNATECYTRTVILDTEIDDFDVTLVGHGEFESVTPTQLVTVTLENVDPSAIEMRVSNLASFSDAYWQPLIPEFDWYLHSGDGTKNVFVAVRDRAGNVAEASGSIMLLQTPPNAPTLQLADVDGDGHAVSAGQVEMMWSVVTGAAKYELQRFVEGVDLEFQEIAGQATVQFVDTITSPGYPHRYRVRAVDSVKNSSDWSGVIVARPYEPVSRAVWIRADDHLRYHFPPNSGTFSMAAKYGHDGPSANDPHYETLPLNQTNWTRNYTPAEGVRWNERLAVRTSNLDSSLVYDTVLPLGLKSVQSLQLGGNRLGLDVDEHRVLHIAEIADRTLWYRTVEDSVVGRRLQIDDCQAWNQADQATLRLDALGAAHIVWSCWDGGWYELRYLTNRADRMLDDFEAALDPAMWEIVSGSVSSSTLAEAPPSGVAALRLSNPGAEIRTAESAQGDSPGGLRYSYQWQPGGGGEMPDAGELLLFEAWNGKGWQLLEAHNGIGGDPPVFRFVSGYLPRATLRVRFRTSGGAGSAEYDYFVDDFRLEERSDTWRSVNLTEGSNPQPAAPSIALDAGGAPHICYYDRLEDRVSYVSYDGQAARHLQINPSVDWGGGVPQGHLRCALDVGPDGAVHAAYPFEYLGSINYSRLPAGAQEFEEPVIFGDGGYPAIAVDANGVAHLAYQQYGAQEPRTWYQTLEVGGEWSEPEEIGVGGWYGLDLRLDSADRPWVAYGDANSSSLYLLRWSGSHWEGSVVIGVPGEVSDPGMAGFLALAVGDEGRAHIAFYSSAGPRYATWVSDTWVPWEESIKVGPPYVGNPSVRPQVLAVDLEGARHVLHRAGIWHTHSLSYATDRSGVWISEEVASFSTNLHSLPVGLAVDRAQDAHIVWADQSSLWYRSTFDGVWQSAEVLVTANVTSSPEVLVSPEGSLHVLYVDGDTSEIKHLTRQGGVWSPAVVADTIGSSFALFSVTTDAVGRLHLIWGLSNGSRLTYSRYDAGAWSQVEDVLVADTILLHEIKVFVSADGSGLHFVASMNRNWNGMALYHFRRGIDGWQSEFHHPLGSTGIAGIGAALDAEGFVHVAFSLDEWVHYATNLGGRWQSSRLLDDTRVDSYLDLAFDRLGRMNVLYEDLDAAEMGVVRGRFSGFIEPLSVERGEVF